ncbi:MAG: hypothetical protein CMH91_12380 [Oceanicaulis sp.]|uniref:hypothetical protein n=1 Tax=unclassified Oceanicaulis TaxID=2632123 RepID=UPI000C5480C9|nr:MULTISPECIES: hypothetical protein [unclassified Oceanicaulis]MAB68867.1 hypothetical protein [Oceanicaulis sp.]MBC39840.1 hypothetical protein [Oceanicaulis sp.]MBG35664.1 hypothetical protein [Oceanicaulis sp.]HCR93727.1 hypothetical protein [Oceanicaulis sp.]|tara:strand:+ start:7208 stop:8206 length:999 start_codon:yes stop_codon:yes gene_type:complete
MTSLIIRVDALHETGLAHAARCSRLLELLPQRPTVHVLGQGEALSDFFPYDKIVPLKGPVDVFLKALVIETEAQAVLVDQPTKDPLLWSALEAMPQLKRILIDDFGSDAPADLAINGTVISDYHAYPNLRDGGQALCGGDYALIAPVFAKSRHDAPRKGPVIAVCGGGERATDWAMMLAEHGPALAKPHPFIIIVGSSFPDFEALRQMAVYNGGIAKKGLPVHQLASHLARAPVAIMTGGMVVYEALAAGTPALVFPQLENLILEIDWFADHGALINLGHESGDNLEQLSSHLNSLLKNEDAIQALSHKGPELIDGLGMSRAAEAISALLEI